MPLHSPDRSDYPAPNRRDSPRYRRSSHKDRSPLARHRASRRSISPSMNSSSYMEAARSPPTRKKYHTSRVRSMNHSEALLKPPAPRSPSPRTMRLKRADTEKDDKRAHRRVDDRNGAVIDRERYSRSKEKGFENQVERGRAEKRLAWNGIEGEGTNLKRYRSVSPEDRRKRARHLSRSPPRARNGARDCEKNSRGSEQLMPKDWKSEIEATEEALETKQMQKPSFELTGNLAAETNRVKGITLLFNEAPDARKPDIRWRLYVFKAAEPLNEPLYIHRQSCYLFGRERRVADIPTDHPSCSKQHAVIQFREVEKKQSDGILSKNVRPYLMDLGSTNKTFLNDNPIEAQRYYELFEKDTIKFGNSSREYVLLHEDSTAL